MVKVNSKGIAIHTQKRVIAILFPIGPRYKQVRKLRIYLFLKGGSWEFTVANLEHHQKCSLNFLNHLWRVIWVKSVSISFYHSTIFLYLVNTPESQFRSLSLASQKSKIPPNGSRSTMARHPLRDWDCTRVFRVEGWRPNHNTTPHGHHAAVPKRARC